MVLSGLGCYLLDTNNALQTFPNTLIVFHSNSVQTYFLLLLNGAYYTEILLSPLARTNLFNLRAGAIQSLSLASLEKAL